MGEIRLQSGDLMPPIVMPDAEGAAFDLEHQSVSGQAMVLWFLPAMPERADAERLAALTDGFSAVEALVFAVAVGTLAAGALKVLAQSGLRVLTDPDGRVAAAFGIEKKAEFVVLDAGRRIVAQTAASDAVLAICTRLFDATPPQIVEGGAPALILDNVLEPAFCRDLIAMWERGQKVENSIAGSGAQRADATIKKRSDVFIDDRTTYETFSERLHKRVFPEIRRAFQSEMVSFEVPRIGCYDARNSGHFSRHRDNRTPYTAHRLFALTINLNTGEYDGGDLRFGEFGRQLYRAPAGGAVIFSCSLLHEAMPVTSGRRFGIFSFLTDAAGQQREQELIRAERAKGAPGISLS